MKRRLVEKNLPPRRERHGRPVVMLADFMANPKAFEYTRVGIRRSNTLRVANGPTVRHGRTNDHEDPTAWWVEKAAE